MIDGAGTHLPRTWNGKAARHWPLPVAPEIAASNEGPTTASSLADLRSIAVQGLVAPEHFRPTRRSQSPAALARAASLLLQLRSHDECRARPAGGAIARNATAQHFRVPTRSSSCSRYRRRSLSARTAGTLRYQACGPALPASSSPAKAWKTPRGARRWKKQALSAAACSISPRSPGHFPSLMIGCHAEAISEDITVDMNGAGGCARWFFARLKPQRWLMRQRPDGLSRRRRLSHRPSHHPGFRRKGRKHPGRVRRTIYPDTGKAFTGRQSKPTNWTLLRKFFYYNANIRSHFGILFQCISSTRLIARSF